MEIILRDDTTEIKQYAFYSNKDITSINIPNNITSIVEMAFSGCTSLTSVTIGENVTSIGNFAFSGCTSLTSVTIGENVTSIGDFAFEGCTSLASVTLGKNVTSIGSYAFWFCTKLTSITLGENVASIGSSAFSGCTSLTSITLPNTVTSIGSQAFNQCYSLAIIYNNSNLTITKGSSDNGYIGYYAQEIIGKGSQAEGDIIEENNVIYYKNGTTVIAIGCAATSPTEIILRDDTTEISEGAFYTNQNITSINIPNSVTSIGDSAFSGCSNLKEVYYEGSLEQWLLINFGGYGANLLSNGADLYIEGDKVTEVTINQNIKQYAFQGCKSLTSVTLGENVTSIGEGAFSDCSNLKEVYYEGSLEQWLLINFGGYNANPLINGADLYIDGEKITEVTINQNIKQYAFQGYKSLVSVTIGENVTSIGSSAFSGCTSLTSVTIGENVTSIGNFAFEDCTSLASVTIGENVTSIGSSAFDDCTSLISVTIESDDIYNAAIGTDIWRHAGGLLTNATTVKVLKTIVDKEGNTNSYLNDTSNFTKTDEGDYYIYTKVK